MEKLYLSIKIYLCVFRCGIKFIGILFPFALIGQFSTVPLNHYEQQWYENGLLRTEHNIHTAVRPWRVNEVSRFSRRGSLLPDSSQIGAGGNKWFKRKLWNEDFLTFIKEDYHVTINPIIAFGLGQENEESSTYEQIYQNSRGLRVEGELGKRFSFYSELVETQARFPLHLNTLAQREEIVPGYWRTKDFRNDGLDFAYAAGEIAYTSAKFFHFRLGRGKQFLGEGHRSLLISDNAVNYPFLRIETTFGKVKYVNLWAVMNDLRPEVSLGDDVPARKYFSMHYLSINIGQHLNLGLFEGLMWGDELNRYGFDVNFLNPIILYRPVEFAQGFDGGNILMGLQFSYRIKPGLLVYGQLAIDEFVFAEIRSWNDGDWRNLIASQLGLKWGDALGVRNLFLRLEYNVVRPHTYSHRDIITNWGHSAQPIAHPLGANFREFLFHLRYQRGRWGGLFSIHQGLLGRDENAESNWGGDIYKSYDERSVDEDVFVGNGVASDWSYLNVELSYTFNPNYNLRMLLGWQNRQEDATNLGLPNSQALYLGLRTNMYNLYQDY